MTDLPDFDPDAPQEKEVIEHDKALTERSGARRVALQVLYELDCTRHSAETVIASHMSTQKMSRKTASYMRRLVRGVLENRERLDKVIQEYAPEWPLGQVAIIDRNILRIATFEFAVQKRTPISVAIDEAVSLARLFGAESAIRFVNGVLGSVADDIDGLRAKLSGLEGDDVE